MESTLGASADSCALVVVDIQERLVKAMPDFHPYGETMVKAVKVAGHLNIAVRVTEQYPKGLGATLGTVRAALPAEAEITEKTTFSCWGSAGFARSMELLRPQTLVLIGMETHVCVQQTALQAKSKGYNVILLADAVCSRRETDREPALQLMAQRNVTVTTLEAFAFDLLRDSKHPAFKDVSALFR